MKHTVTIMGIFLTVLLLFAVGPVSSVTWHTYREDVTITTGYTDISNVLTLATNLAWINESGNITLPCNIGNLTLMNFSFYNVSGADNGHTAGGGQTYNLTINGIDVNSSSWINGSNQRNWTTLAQYTAAGGSQTAKYISWVVDGQCGYILNMSINATDATLSTTYLAANLTIKEKDVTTPTVGTSSSSFWTVNNSINITANPYLINLTNLIFNLTYVSQTVGTPSITNVTLTHATNGTATENYTQYQKRGPYTYDIDEDVSGADHEVTIYIKCDEVLTNVVDWTIDPDDDYYDGFFDTVDNDSLVIELNNVVQDWEMDGDNIELEDFTVRTTHTLNKFVFTWTVPAAVEPVAAPAWYLAEAFFIPIWIWVTIIAIIAVAGVAVVYQYYYKK